MINVLTGQVLHLVYYCALSQTPHPSSKDCPGAKWVCPPQTLQCSMRPLCMSYRPQSDIAAFFLQAKVFLAFLPVHEPETAPHRNARLAGLKDIITILHRCAAAVSSGAAEGSRETRGPQSVSLQQIM